MEGGKGIVGVGRFPAEILGGGGGGGVWIGAAGIAGRLLGRRWVWQPCWLCRLMDGLIRHLHLDLALAFDWLTVKRHRWSYLVGAAGYYCKRWTSLCAAGGVLAVESSLIRFKCILEHPSRRAYVDEVSQNGRSNEDGRIHLAHRQPRANKRRTPNGVKKRYTCIY